MNKNNPACYECVASPNKLHVWKRNDDLSAYCKWCRVVLTKEQTIDVWNEE